MRVTEISSCIFFVFAKNETNKLVLRKEFYIL